MPQGLPNTRSPYRLKTLRRGTAADVFLGWLEGSQSPEITLKALSLDALRSPRLRYRFACECAVLAQLGCSGFPRLEIASPEPENGAWLAYRYIEGVTLRETLAAVEGLDTRRRMALVGLLLRDILPLLSYLRALPGRYAHGDIAPSNIIVGPNRLSLIDLGIAHASESEISDYDLFTVGQPAYISPEQAQGRFWDGASDRYQLGLVLYEILVGRRYNTGRNLSECRLNAAASSTSKLRGSTVPPPLAGLTECLLDPAPESRPTIEEIGALTRQIGIQDSYQARSKRRAAKPNMSGGL